MLELKLNKEEVMSLIDKEELARHIANKFWTKYSEDSTDPFDPIRKQIINTIELETKEIVNDWMNALDNKRDIEILVEKAISNITKQDILNKLT